MSYSTLIFNDSPEAVWSLEETDGLTVKVDSFVNNPDYDGIYESGKFIRSYIPITYGGSVCIQNNGPFDGSANYSSNNKMFSLPSLGKFSSATRSQSYTLEFWMNLSIDITSLSSGPGSRIGDSAVVKISGSSNSGLYIRDLDYLVFKISDSGYRSFESAVHVRNWNTPIHIFVVYTPYSIQLIVNGVEGTNTLITEEIFGNEEERTIDFLFPDKISSSSLYFDHISYDTVAIYKTSLNSSVAKRHYIYGLGYNVPKYLIKSLNGVSYKSNMQLTTPLRQINYINNSSFSNRLILNNLNTSPNNISSVQYSNQFLSIVSLDKTAKKTDMVTSDGIIFPENSYSYLEVSNYENITGGEHKTVEAKFKILSVHAHDEQQVMYIGSKSISSKYISATITNRNIIVKSKEENGLESTVVTHAIDSLATLFSISIVKSSGTITISVCDDQTSSATTGTITNTTMFPFSDSYIRIGSTPSFFEENVPANISSEDIKRFDGSLLQLDIHENLDLPVNISSYPIQKQSNLYQIYYKPDTKNIAVATKGTFSLTLSLLDLIGIDSIGELSDNVNLASKVEIGSQSAEITYDLIDVPATTIVSGQDVRKLSLPSSVIGKNVENLQYQITGTVRSSDILTNPGILDHFRIYTYESELEGSRSYIEINDDHPGNNIKYFSGYQSSINQEFVILPELERTSDLHRSFNTGMKIGTHGSTNPYIKIPFSTSGINSPSNPKIQTIMFDARHISGTESNVEFFRTPETSPTHIVTIGSLETTGVEVLVNGIEHTSQTYNWDAWNHVTIRIPDGIDYESELFFGYSGSGWSIDNLNIFTEYLDNQKVQYLYKSYFSSQGIRVPEETAQTSTTFINMLITDSELSDSKTVYQPLTGQNSFLSETISPSLASTKNVSIVNVSGSTWDLNYNTDRNLLKIDDVQIKQNDLILLKDQLTPSQNGIYLVSSINALKAVLIKQTTPSDGSVIFIRDGNENKNYYFLKNLNSYSKTIVQKKVISYNDVSPSVTALVRSAT